MPISLGTSTAVIGLPSRSGAFGRLPAVVGLGRHLRRRAVAAGKRVDRQLVRPVPPALRHGARRQQRRTQTDTEISQHVPGPPGGPRSFGRPALLMTQAMPWFKRLGGDAVGSPDRASGARVRRHRCQANGGSDHGQQVHQRRRGGEFRRDHAARPGLLGRRRRCSAPSSSACSPNSPPARSRRGGPPRSAWACTRAPPATSSTPWSRWACSSAGTDRLRNTPATDLYLDRAKPTYIGGCWRWPTRGSTRSGAG